MIDNTTRILVATHLMSGMIANTDRYARFRDVHKMPFTAYLQRCAGEALQGADFLLAAAQSSSPPTPEPLDEPPAKPSEIQPDQGGTFVPSLEFPSPHVLSATGVDRSQDASSRPPPTTQRPGAQTSEAANT